MQTLDIKGLVARDSATRRYVLTDTGRAVLGALLEHGGIKPKGRTGGHRAGPETGRPCDLPGWVVLTRSQCSCGRARPGGERADLRVPMGM